MRIPRWFWWLLGSIAAIVSGPFLLLALFAGLQWLDERPHSFEEKVQLKGAAVWTSGTTRSPAISGDACSIKYTLQFARTGQDREAVEDIENTFAESCFTDRTLSRATWFGFGNGTYLNVSDDIYARISQGRWRKHSLDWGDRWALSLTKTNEGQVIYRRQTKDRTFYRVFQLPQNVGDKWMLIRQKSLPRKRTGKDLIVTTEDELEGFHIVKAILRQNVDPHRIIARDTQSYFGILLDDNNRKPLARLYFNRGQKYLGLFDDSRQETRIGITDLNEIYAHTEELEKVLAFYERAPKESG